jgi:hypothetical protein
MVELNLGGLQMFQNLKIKAYAFWLLFLSLFAFPIFLFQMIVLAFQLWKNKATMRASQVLPMMVVHYNKRMTDPAAIVGQLDKSVSEPFKKLHGYPPVVLCMPLGMTISALNFDDFLEIMNRDQLRLFKNALYKKTNNIEVVKNMDELDREQVKGFGT